MATISTPVYPRPRLRILRVVALVLSLISLVVLGICAWVYSVARSALPQLDGKVHVAGLSSPVTVIRDAHGAPTIEAANFDDLFFAQGYVTAQDRLFQMDGMRRFAGGELAEILGSDFVKHDRRAENPGPENNGNKDSGEYTTRESCSLRGVCARRERIYRDPSGPIAVGISHSAIFAAAVDA